MLTKGAGFARYSKGLCWSVSLIWLCLSILSFTGEANNSAINGLLWLAGAVTFAISAFLLGKEEQAEADSSSSNSNEQSV